MFDIFSEGLGISIFLTSIIVEILKRVLPKSIPTQILTLIVSMLVCFSFSIVEGDLTLNTVIPNFFNGFINAYGSMYGYDTIKDLWNRLNSSGGDE